MVDSKILPLSDVNIVMQHEPILFGRDELVDNLKSASTNGCKFFALEGASGVGKTVLSRQLTGCFAKQINGHEVNIDLAMCQTERLLIGALLNSFRECRPRGRIDSAAIRKRVENSILPTVRKLLGAVVADGIKFATDKVENISEALKDIIQGGETRSDLEKRLSTEAIDNQRFFISNFIGLLAELGINAVICLDNVEAADNSALELVNVLTNLLPNSWRLTLVTNIESPESLAWRTRLRPKLEACSAEITVVGELDDLAITAWFHAEIGRNPSAFELSTLANRSKRRAYSVAQLLAEVRTGVTVWKLPDFEGYQRQARLALTPDAKKIGDLLAVINDDTLVPKDLLELAGTKFGVLDMGSAFDTLLSAGLLRVIGNQISLCHLVAQQSWRATLDMNTIRRIGDAWYAALVNWDQAKLSNPALISLVPLITDQIIKNQTPEAVSVASIELLKKGATREGLALVDAAWSTSAAYQSETAIMIKNALLAARTRLDLGQYERVDEPLRLVENMPNLERAFQAESRLLRLKLALRRNAYKAVWTIAQTIEIEFPELTQIQIEKAMIVNVAYRDLMDEKGLASSIIELKKYDSDALLPNERSSLHRSLARSFAKLNSVKASISYANRSLEFAMISNSIRDIGNAFLAIGESRRYALDFGAAGDAFQQAAELARASGNRDSWLWCLLGSAANAIAWRRFDLTEQRLGEVKALLKEPGYEHPLETLHEQLLSQVATSLLNSKEIVVNTETLESYDRLGIQWPRSINRFSSGTAPQTFVAPL